MSARNAYGLAIGFIVAAAIALFYLFPEEDSIKPESLVPAHKAPQLPKAPSPAQEEETIHTASGTWESVFIDHFTDASLDAGKWTAFAQEENYNNELQAYVPENAIIADGVLHLIAKNERYESRRYTSARIDTKGKFSFHYGRVEIRARHPQGKGLFPALWMLPDKNKSLPEIDIMEVVGDEPKLVYAVNHEKKNGGLHSYSNSKRIGQLDDFHVYSMEWEPEEIRWYVDGKKFFVSRRGVPHEPMHLILNLAIGGNWPGDPNKKTKFPAVFEVDYVKIYKKLE